MAFKIIRYDEVIFTSEKPNIYEALLEFMDNGNDSNDIVAIIPDWY